MLVRGFVIRRFEHTSIFTALPAQTLTPRSPMPFRDASYSAARVAVRQHSPLSPVDIVPSSSTVHALTACLLADAALWLVPPPSGVVSSENAAPVRRGEEVASDALSRAEQLWGTLGLALSAWCGPFAYHALLSRALSQAQTTHLPLSALRVGMPSAPQLEGLGVLSATGGDSAIAEASQALLSALIKLLARVIGEVMAIDTVTQALTVLRAVPHHGQQPVKGDTGS